MRLLDRIRVRQIIAVIVVIPVIVAAFSALALARGAKANQLAASREVDELSVFMAIRDLEAAVTTELALYGGVASLATQSTTDIDALAVIQLALTPALQATTDDVFSESLNILDELGRDEEAGIVDSLQAALGVARVEFASGDFITLLADKPLVDAALASTSDVADALLAGKGANWSTLERQAEYPIRLADEMLVIGSALFIGSTSDKDRQSLAVRIDRAEAAYQDFLSASTPEQQEALQASLDLTGIVGYREMILATPEFEPMSPVNISLILNSFDAHVADIAELRKDTVAVVSAEAAQAARDAESRYRFLLTLTAMVVILPTTLAAVAGGRLSRRIEGLADAARRVSNGDLNVDIHEASGRDEVAVLTGALREVTKTVSLSHAQISALADGRYDAEVLSEEVPGKIGKTLRSAVQRLSSAATELAHYANHDKLTGLLDRRGLEDSLARSEATDWVLALIDLDGFKFVNDHHGHSAGDAVLVAIARRLQASVREGDLVCRIGGDEFLVAAPSSEADDLSPMVDRIVERASRPIEWEGVQLKITASVGWTMVHNTETFDTALHRADEAMYVAKRQGKDRARFVTMAG